MEQINTNKIRIGNFTSSEIWKLTKEGKTKGTVGSPALTYIQEKNVERAFELPLKTDVWSKEIAWGNWVEQFAFAKLGFEYTLSSQTSKQHEQHCLHYVVTVFVSGIWASALADPFPQPVFRLRKSARSAGESAVKHIREEQANNKE